eukprot:2433590-Pyramimonas_sp.AAC.1
MVVVVEKQPIKGASHDATKISLSRFLTAQKEGHPKDENACSDVVTLGGSDDVARLESLHFDLAMLDLNKVKDLDEDKDKGFSNGGRGAGSIPKPMRFDLQTFWRKKCWVPDCYPLIKLGTWDECSYYGDEDSWADFHHHYHR